MAISKKKSLSTNFIYVIEEITKQINVAKEVLGPRTINRYHIRMKSSPTIIFINVLIKH